MRTQQTYILLDNSIVMSGKPIQEFKQLIIELINYLKFYPHKIKTVCLSVITYNSQEVISLLPLTPIWYVSKDFDIICRGKFDLNGGLRFLESEVTKNTKIQSAHLKCDFKPILYIITGVAQTQLDLKHNSFNFLIDKIDNGYGVKIDASISIINLETDFKNKTAYIIAFQTGYVMDYFKRFFENVYCLTDNINSKIKQPFYFHS